MLNLGGADTMCKRTECAMGRSMGVTTDYCHTGQCCALLGTDNMHDTLADIVHLELGDPEIIAVPVERLDLQAGDRILDRLATVCRWNIVVRGRKIGIDAPGRAMRDPQALESLGRGDLVHKLAIDV